MPYLGAVKPTETTSSVLRSTYTGDGSTTTFNLPGPVANETSIIATINGVTQQDAAYTTNGSQIIFSGAPALGDSIELRTISGVGLSYAPSAGSVTTGILADGAVTSGKINDASVTGAKLGTGAAVANIGARAITAAQVPAGSVIQVVSLADTVQRSVATNVMSASGMLVTITPTSATSKIFVQFDTSVFRNQGGSGYFSIFRGGTNLAGSGNQLNMFSIQDSYVPLSISFLDSPASTSALTYEVYYARSNAGNIYINATNSGSTKGSLTVMEIAA
jgi:hypothetical protein